MENEILNVIADTIEMDSVKGSFKLSDDVWDSLAVIIFIAAINKSYGKVLNPEQIFSAKTAQDLVDIVMQSD